MDKARTINLGMYAAASAGAVMSTLPDYTFLNIGLILIFVVLILAYLLRRQEAEDSLSHHHLTYMIRTIWIYSLLAVPCMTIAALVIFDKGDQSAMNALIDEALGGVMPTDANIKQAESAYLASNETLIIQTYIVCMFPALIYLLWRITRGATRAYHNYRLQNMRAWF